MSKMNVRVSALAVALLLTVVAMMSPAIAACTPGATRTIIANPECCAYPQVKVTKQNQVCNSSGVWVNNGSSAHTVTTAGWSRTLQPGQQYSRVVKSGFRYHCKFHSGMTGRVAVR